MAAHAAARPVLFAVFLNVGALGLKWERRREAMGDGEPRTKSQ